MRLRHKFTKSFVTLIFIAITSSIILSVILLTKFNNGLINNEQINSIIKEYSYTSAKPPILSARTLIYKDFQPLIYQINELRRYLLYFHENEEILNFDNSHINNFLNKYLVNGFDLAVNYKTISSEMIKKNSTEPFHYLDNIVWYVNPTITKLSDLTEEQVRLLYSVANIIPLLRALYEPTKNYNDKGPIATYMYFDKHELFITYPIDLQRENQYGHFKEFTNPSTCTNNELKTPSYYFAPCRDWYIDSEKLYKSLGKTTIITPPYIYASSKDLGVTICNKIPDEEETNKNTISSNSILKNTLGGVKICIDKVKNELFKILDQLNKLVDGYFFITRVNSDIPFYYPNINSIPYISTIVKHEFDLNITYFTEEIASYKAASDVFKAFNATYNRNVNFKDPVQEGSFLKNNETITYTLFPISFYSVPESPSEYSHTFNIVFLHLKTAAQSLVSSSLQRQLPKIIIQLVLLILLGIMILLLVWQLVVGLADNIVRPIKDLKKIIQDLQKNRGLSSDVKFNEQGKKINNKTSFIGSSINDNFNNDTQDDNVHDDENTLIIARSEQIDYIFNLLFKLKKVMGFATTGKLENENYAFLDYVYARTTFKEVKNIKGKDLCESNLGNIALKLKKFDKAIIHFNQSIMPLKRYFPKNISDANEFFNLKEKKFKVKKNKINYYNTNASKNSLNLNNEDKEQIESLKSNYLESRYPKLLHSLKTFFELIYQVIDESSQENQSESMNAESNYLVKYQNKMLGVNKFLSREVKENKNTRNRILETGKLLEEDVYCMLECHSLDYYHQILKEYLYLSINNGKLKQVIEAAVEYNEFLIKYQLKSNPIVEEFIKNRRKVNNITSKNDYDFESLEKTIETIYSNFIEIDRLMEQLKLTIDMEYIRNYHNLLKNAFTESQEYLEAPIFIINSKINLIKGEYFYIIGDFKNAFKYYSDAYNMNIISDAKLTVKAGRSIKELLSCCNEFLDYEKNYVESVNLSDIKNLNYVILLGEDKNFTDDIEALTEELSKIKASAKEIKENKEHKDGNNKETKETKDKFKLNHSDSKININSTRDNKENKENKDNLKDSNQQTLLTKLKNLDKTTLLKNIQNKKKEISNYITNVDEFIDIFVAEPKDILVLIDTNLRSDTKKIDQFQNVVKQIFLKLVTCADRFSLGSFGQSFNILINLNQKNKLSFDFLKKEMEDINKMFVEASPVDQNTSDSNMSSNIVKGIITAFNYLNVKSFNRREKWLIILSDFIDEDQQVMLGEKLEKFVFNMSNPKLSNLVLVSFNKASHIKDEYYNKMKNIFAEKTKIKNKIFIAFDEIEVLKQSMKTVGRIKNESSYSFEKYSSKA